MTSKMFPLPLATTAFVVGRSPQTTSDRDYDYDDDHDYDYNTN